jgi:hypothetical protein
MSITSQGKKNAKPRNKWDEAIADAKRRTKGRKFTIEVFKQRKKKGEPWPGGSAKRNTANEKAAA